MNERKKNPMRLLVAGAMLVGVAGGSYGIASAASGSGAATRTAATPAAVAPAATAPAPNPQQPWGGQRGDETVLTGDTASKVEAAAKAEVSGGTIVRVETDADGHALYEAHMTKADGTPVTVYVDKDFNVVSIESR